MSPLAVAGVVFGCVFGGALHGMLLRTGLPPHHLSPRPAGRPCEGLLRHPEDRADTDVGEGRHPRSRAPPYGPESKEARDLLRRFVVGTLARIWPEQGAGSAQLAPVSAEGETFFDKVQALAPKNDAQRSLRARAIGITMDVGQARQLMFQESDSSISMPLRVVVVFWLAIIFTSFGLFAHPNGLAISVLLISAISVSAAIFLILELDRPFDGLIRISSGPLRSALANLGR